MSRINGEKARAAIAQKRRTARRVKEKELRAQLLAAAPKKHLTLVDKAVAEIKEVPSKMAVPIKKAGDALAELAEMVKPKTRKKKEPAGGETPQ